MTEWAAIRNVSTGTLFARKADGWSDRRILETLSVEAWSNRTGIKAGTIRQRLRRGWSVPVVLTP